MRELVGGARGRGLAPGFKLERPTVNDSIERERGRFVPRVIVNLWSSLGGEETTPTRGSGGGGW